MAHCKTLAKLCAGQNKPNGQTVLPRAQVEELYSTLPLNKVSISTGVMVEETGLFGLISEIDRVLLEFVLLACNSDQLTRTRIGQPTIYHD